MQTRSLIGAEGHLASDFYNCLATWSDFVTTGISAGVHPADFTRISIGRFLARGYRNCQISGYNPGYGGAEEEM
jgi:hypothetical protein